MSSDIRVGFRYQDGEVLSPEREARSEDIELPVAVIDLGDGEWLTLGELRDLHAERLEADAPWGVERNTPAQDSCACGSPETYSLNPAEVVTHSAKVCRVSPVSDGGAS